MNENLTRNPPLPAADADGAAIASVFAAFLFPPLAIFLGRVSRQQARQRGLRPSPVANLGYLLGWLLTVAWIVLFFMLLAAASGNPLPAPCSTASPGYPYC